MCLNTIQEKTTVAKEDIICYKVLTYRMDNTTGDLLYMSPFYDFVWYRNNPNNIFSYYIADTSWWIDHGKEDKQLSNIAYYDHKGVRHKQYQVCSGYFHTFKSLLGATCFFKKFHASVIVECTIPKGTTYYEGYDSGGIQGYASTNLRINKHLRQKIS